jgi:hypothetical protein
MQVLDLQVSATERLEVSPDASIAAAASIAMAEGLDRLVTARSTTDWAPIMGPSCEQERLQALRRVGPCHIPGND